MIPGIMFPWNQRFPLILRTIEQTDPAGFRVEHNREPGRPENTARRAKGNDSGELRDWQPITGQLNFGNSSGLNRPMKLAGVF